MEVKEAMLDITKDKDVLLDHRNRTDIKPKARPFFFKAKNNKNLAILVHGFSASPIEMEELGRYLANHGINARGALLAGHGGDYEHFELADYKDWWKSIKKEVDHFKDDYDNIFLIGYSFGSNIVMDIAARFPSNFKGVVCLGPSLFLRRAKAIKFLYHFFSLYRDKANKWRMSKARRAIYESKGSHVTLPLKTLGNFLDFMEKVTKNELEQFTSPILLIHSRDDEVSSPKSSEMIFEKIRSEDKELFILNEFEHNPLNSRNKDLIFEKVISFIGAHI